MATKTLVTTFADAREAEAVVHKLHEAGFARDDIGWISKTEIGDEVAQGDASTVRNSALEGMGVGGALGGLAGLLIGFAALAVPGVGPVVVAGPLVSALAGAGLGAAAGGLIDALVHVGVPKAEAHRYAERVNAGGAIVTVTVDDDEEEQRALELLKMEATAHGHDVRTRISPRAFDDRPSLT